MRRGRFILAGLLLAVCVWTDDKTRALIDISVDAGLTVLTFDLTSGTEYWVDCRTNLPAGAWGEIGAGHAGSGKDSHALAPSGDDLRFFRLRYLDNVVDMDEGDDLSESDFEVITNRSDSLQKAYENEGDGGASSFLTSPATHTPA